jgi:hypothetical protein
MLLSTPAVLIAELIIKMTFLPFSLQPVVHAGPLVNTLQDSLPPAKEFGGHNTLCTSADERKKRNKARYHMGLKQAPRLCQLVLIVYKGKAKQRRRWNLFR